jgi:biotin carboxyl carrier protein
MDLHFEHAGNELTIAALRSGEGWRIELPSGATYEATIDDVPGSVRTIRAVRATSGEPAGTERFLRVPVVHDGRAIAISWAGHVFRFTPSVPGAISKAAAKEGHGTVTAPAGGIVVDVPVSESDHVAAGQRVAVIEAMKVMTPVEASGTGRISKVFVAAGQRVEQGAPIVEIDVESGDRPETGAAE